MSQTVKLFDRKRRCLDNYLKDTDQVTAVSGFDSFIVVGTSSGVLLIFDTCTEGKGSNIWKEEAKLMLSEKVY